MSKTETLSLGLTAFARLCAQQSTQHHGEEMVTAVPRAFEEIASGVRALADAIDIRRDRATVADTKLMGWARTVLGGESISHDDAHQVLTELGAFEPHEGACDYKNGCCPRCGKWCSGAEFMAAVEAARAERTPEEQAELDDEFFGPCPHGRDPWTRCDEGCDTEEQARGLKPPSATVAQQLEQAWSAGARHAVEQMVATGTIHPSVDGYEDANPYRSKG